MAEQAQEEEQKPNAKPDTAEPAASDNHAIDPRRIILPQKAGPSTLSASRAPAGETLRSANYVPAGATIMPHAPERLQDIPKTAANALPDTPALHTFKGDIASTIEKRNISLADIAQAQNARKKKEPDHESRLLSIVQHPLRATEYAVGIALMLSAFGVFFWIYERSQPLPPAVNAIAPYIYVDQSQQINLPPDISRGGLMVAMEKFEGSSLSLGLIEQLQLLTASSAPSGAPTLMNTRSFFSIVAPNAPDSLVRSLDPVFLFGFHSYGGNQSFLIFKTDAYEQAFAGMLQWEYTMQTDLAPLFPYTKTPSAAAASSTRLFSGITSSPFSDAVLNNHDVRAARNSQGNVELLWSFVDRGTLVITTNPSTLQEIVSRLQKAPTIIIPH